MQIRKNQGFSLVIGLLATFLFNTAQAQVKVGDNPTNIDARSVLELESTTKGLYLPRITTAQLDAVSGWKEGMVVYNTDEDCIKIFDGTTWECVDAGNEWEDVTVRGVDMVIASQAAAAGDTVIITDDGRVGIGTTVPDIALDVETSSNNGLGKFVIRTTTGENTGLVVRAKGIGATKNIGGSFLAKGATTNVALEASEGDVLLNTTSGKGNTGIGTTTPQYKLEVAGGAIMLEDASAPSAASGHSGLYSSSGELNAIDASGNSTVISPHHFSLVAPSEDMAWSFYSKNERIGQQVNVDMMRAIRLIEAVTGEQLIHRADLNGSEISETNTEKISLKEKLAKQEVLIQELTKRIIQLEENQK